MDFENDVDLTLVAPPIVEFKFSGATPHEWDAYVRGGLVSLSDFNVYAGSSSVTQFEPGEAERLGRRLIAAAAVARAAQP